jgi:hypothetical protein
MGIATHPHEAFAHVQMKTILRDKEVSQLLPQAKSFLRDL